MRQLNFLKDFSLWGSGPPLFLVLPVLPPLGGLAGVCWGCGLPAGCKPVPVLGSLTDRWVINLLTGWSLTEAVVFMPLGQVSLQGFSGQTDRSDNAS